MSLKLINHTLITDLKCRDRLTKGQITLLCETSFDNEDLESKENESMYIFVETIEDETKYIGFCRINVEHNYVDRFEIFTEYRLQGYGRIFVNLIKETFGVTDYYQILDEAIGFWTKMYDNDHNLFQEMLSNVIEGSESFEQFCQRLNYDHYDKAYKIFQSILQNK